MDVTSTDLQLTGGSVSGTPMLRSSSLLAQVQPRGSHESNKRSVIYEFLGLALGIIGMAGGIELSRLLISWLSLWTVMKVSRMRQWNWWTLK